MAKAAPFLKMYSLYVQHFDEAMNTIKSNQEKNSAFDTLIKSIEKLPECNFLTLQVSGFVILFWCEREWLKKCNGILGFQKWFSFEWRSYLFRITAVSRTRN